MTVRAQADWAAMAKDGGRDRSSRVVASRMLWKDGSRISRNGQMARAIGPRLKGWKGAAFRGRAANPQRDRGQALRERSRAGPRHRRHDHLHPRLPQPEVGAAGVRRRSGHAHAHALGELPTCPSAASSSCWCRPSPSSATPGAWARPASTRSRSRCGPPACATTSATPARRMRDRFKRDE